MKIIVQTRKYTICYKRNTVLYKVSVTSRIYLETKDCAHLSRFTIVVPVRKIVVLPIEVFLIPFVVIVTISIMIHNRRKILPNYRQEQFDDAKTSYQFKVALKNI